MIRLASSLLIVFCLIVCLFPATSQARSRSRSWAIEFTPYAWLAGMSGEIVVDGEPASIDYSFNDMWKFRTWGMTFHVEAKRDVWALIFDFKFTRRDEEEDATRVELNTWLGEAGAAYEVVDRFEVLAGGRFINADAEIIEDQISSFKRTESWVDPIVGGRYSWEFVKDWTFIARGDIGGFGVGSDFSWNVVAGVDWHVVNVSFFFGYRIFGVDYSKGSGADLFKYDVVRSGPGIGMTFYLGGG